MLNGYDDYDDGWGWPARVGAAAVGVLALGAILWFVVLPIGGGSDDGQLVTAGPQAQSADAAAPTSAATTLDSADDSPERAGDDSDQVVDDSDTADTETSPTMPTSSDQETSTDAGTPSTDAVTPSTDAVTPSTDAGPTTAPAPQSSANYPTLPDGSPVPVLAIYDGALITLSGVVPSEAAAQRLRVLALANSTVPDAEVASFLTIEPTVPLGVGVRVIEMNSARFPEGSPTIEPAHAAQLDRIVSVMNALPHITVVVIGHADQRGDEETNFVLSADRARAAADYVASAGVDPSRLSSRGAGESDLLTLNNDDAALALNRRTEFVFFGLLVEAPEPS